MRGPAGLIYATPIFCLSSAICATVCDGCHLQSPPERVDGAGLNQVFERYGNHITIPRLISRVIHHVLKSGCEAWLYRAAPGLAVLPFIFRNCVDVTQKLDGLSIFRGLEGTYLLAGLSKA